MSTERYPLRNGKHCIEIKLNQLKQLFSTHDPSPFRERDLDDDAVDYIMGSLKELKYDAPVRLVIHIPGEQIWENTHQETTHAIHNYFNYEEEIVRKKMRSLLKQGEVFLLIGLTFLFICLYSSYFILSKFDSVFMHILGEGLNIIGWVAMWKPLEILLYDWRPMNRARAYYLKLSQIEVELQVRNPSQENG